jgi:hypothetical protein
LGRSKKPPQLAEARFQIFGINGGFSRHGGNYQAERSSQTPGWQGYSGLDFNSRGVLSFSPNVNDSPPPEQNPAPKPPNSGWVSSVFDFAKKVVEIMKDTPRHALPFVFVFALVPIVGVTICFMHWALACGFMVFTAILALVVLRPTLAAERRSRFIQEHNETFQSLRTAHGT